MPSLASKPLRVAIYCSDPARCAQLKLALAGHEIHEFAASSPSVLPELCDVVVLCDVPRDALLERVSTHAAVVWFAPEPPGCDVDVWLPPTVGDTELCECVELMGRQTTLVREMEEHAAAIESAALRFDWRGRRAWQSHGELLKLASTDSLTGAFSRRHLVDALRTEIELLRTVGGSLSFLLLDLDDFKPVNDRWGHRAGDTALRELVARMQVATRAGDSVCRFGGDEFAVVARACNVASASVLAERLLRAVAERPIQLEGHDVRITCSIGVASSTPDDRTTLDELIRRADLALLAAKLCGGNVARHWTELPAENERSIRS